MKGVKNYLKNVTKSIVYASADVAKKDLMPNVGDFVDSNKEFLATTYSVLKDPKTFTKKQVESFKNSKYYEAIDYGAKNIFDDIKTGKFYNKEREDKDSLRFAGSSFNDDLDDLSEFGIDDNWEEEYENKKNNTKDEVTSGDLKIVESIESSNMAAANTTAKAIAYAADSGNKNSRINTSILFSQNERLFAGLHSDMSIVNATLDSMHKVVTQALPNIDKNMADYFSEASKDRKETNAMLKELLEIQRKTAGDFETEQNNKKKSNGTRWSDISGSGGLPDLSAYAKMIGNNVKKKITKSTGGIADMLGEDSNMLAAMMANPLGEVMKSLVSSVIPASMKMATQELDKSISSVFGTFITRLDNASKDEDANPILSFLSKFLGVKTDVNRSIDTSKYYKGAIPFDGITRKAIVDVIPSYLRRIEAAVTRREEVLYDYDSGSWKTVKSAKTDFENIKKNAINSGTSAIMSKMSPALNIVKKGISNAQEKKEFEQAIEEFKEYLYMRGEHNPKVGPEKNGISYGNFPMLYKYYTEINTAFINYDFDTKTGRHTDLSGKMGFAQDVLRSKDYEDQQYRQLEKSGHSAIAQVKAKGFYANTNGKFDKKTDKFIANDPLSQSKDNLGNSVFDYLQKIAAELGYMRIENSTYFAYAPKAATSINYTDKDGKIKSIKLPTMGNKLSDSDIRSLLISDSKQKDLSNESARMVREYNEAIDKAEKEILAGKAVDYNFKEDNPKEYEETLANMIAQGATKEYYDQQKSIAESNSLSKYMNNKFYNPKLADEINKAMDEAEKETKNDKPKDESAVGEFMARAKSARDKVQAVIGAPAEIFTNLLYTADRAIYDMMFKAEIKNEDGDDDHKTYNGFMEMIAGKANSVMDKASNAIHKNILDPIMKRLGIEDPEKFKGDVTDAFKNMGGKFVKKFVESNKDVYGPLYQKVKKTIFKEKVDPYTLSHEKGDPNTFEYRRKEREYRKAHPENERLRRNAMKAVATGNYNIPEAHQDLLETVEERREYLLKNGIIDPFKMRYYNNDAINKAYFRHVQRTHAAGTMTPDGKPFQGLSTLHAGEAIFNSNGSSIVPKTGLYNITEPTHILNRYDTNELVGIKNNKSKASTIASDLIDEKKVKNNIFHHPNGTEDTENKASASEKVGKSISDAVDDVKKKYKDLDINFDTVKENAKLYMPEGIAGGVVGGVASTLLGIVGGPIIGALLGSTAGIVSSSDQLKDKFFGKKDDNGKRNGGKLFGKEVMGFINKYVPDMGKYGLAGVLPGLITPLGPVGGMLVGAGVGFLKNNDKFMDKYFGEKNDDGTRNGGKLSLDGKTKGILKKIAPGALKGAGAGALTSLVFGGPFGLLGNAAIGSAIGMATTTDAFKDGILGKLKDGVREGGLVGELRRAADPLKESLKEAGSRIIDAFDKNIVDPLSRFISPAIHQLYLGLSFIPRKIAGVLEDKIAKPISGWLGEKLAKVGGGLLNLGSKAFSAVTTPFRLLGAAGDAMTRHQIKNGNGIANSKTARERMDIMTGKMKKKAHETDEEYQARLRDSYSGYTRDAALASIGSEAGLSIDQAKNIRSQIQLLTDTKEHLKAAKDKKSKEILNNLKSWKRDGSDAKISRSALKEITKALKNDELQLVEDILQKWDLVDTKVGESKRMTNEEIESIMNGRNGEKGIRSKLSEFKDLTKRKKALGKINGKEKRDSMTKNVLDELNKAGFNVGNDASKLGDFSELLNTEIVNREANTKGKTKTEIIDDKLNKANSENIAQSTSYLKDIYNLLSGASKEIKQMSPETNAPNQNIEDLSRSKDSAYTGKFEDAKFKATNKGKGLLWDIVHYVRGENNENYDDEAVNKEVQKTDEVESHGIGTFLLNGAKKIGKGVLNLGKKALGGKKSKAQQDISDAAEDKKASSISNLDEIDKKGDNKDIVVNPENGDAIQMKRGSDGQVEPDTSDSKTKAILNKLDIKEKFKKKLEEAQLKAAEISSEAFEGEQQGGKKMKWWQLLLYGMVAAPFIKKLFNNFVKPIWNDKLKPWIKDKWENNILPGIKSVGSAIISALPGIASTIASAITSAIPSICTTILDTIAGNKDNAGGSTTINPDELQSHDPNELSPFIGSDGKQLTYGEISQAIESGNNDNITILNGQNEQGTINEDGSITFNDDSMHGSSFLKKMGNGMLHNFIRGSAGIGTEAVSKLAGKALKGKGIVSKGAGLVGKAITEPLKFAAKPSKYLNNINEGIMTKISNSALNSATKFKDGGKIQNKLMKIASGAEDLANGSAAETVVKGAKGTKGLLQKVISSVSGFIENLFSNTKVATKLAQCAAALGKKEPVKFIMSLKDKIIDIIQGALKKGADKYAESALHGILSKVGNVVKKIIGPVTIAADFLSGCDRAEAILGVQDTSILEEVVAGIINAVCNFFTVLTIFPGVNWIAQKIMGIFNKDLKERQAEADKEYEEYKSTTGSTYSKEEYLESQKSYIGKAKVGIKNTFGKIKNAFSNNKDEEDESNNNVPSKKELIKSGVNYIKEKGGNALDAIKDTAKASWNQAKDVGADISKLWEYAKSGDLANFYGYDGEDEEKDDSVRGKINHLILTAMKTPLSIVAIPAKVINTVKDKAIETIKTIAGIKANNDKVINQAMNGEISVFSSDYWKVNATNDGLVGGLETVYDYITRILKAPFVLIGSVFNKVKDWFNEKLESIKDKIGDVKKLFTNPIEYFKDKLLNKNSSSSSGASTSSGTSSKLTLGSAASKAADKVKSLFGKGYDKQIDPAIANIRFNAPGDTQYQTIGDSACGPAAAVTAVKSAFGRGAGDVLNASKFAISGGYKEKDGGTKPDFFKDYFNKQGLNSSMSYNKSEIMNNIKSGRPTVLMGSDSNGVSNKTPYGKNPHYVTVTGMDGRGNAIVQDPESKQDNQLYKINSLLNKSSFGVSVTGRSKFGRSKYGRGLRGGCINEQAYNYFIDHGLSAAAAAGAVGNLMAEAGTDSSGQIKASAVESNGEGVGIVQWSFERKTAFLNYCQSKGKPFPNDDLGLQLDYIMIELNSGQHWSPHDAYGHPEYCISYEQFKSASDPSMAAGAWMTCYERPSARYAHLDNRIQNAVNIYNQYSGNTAQAATDGAGGSTDGSSGGTASNPISGLIGKLGQTKVGRALSAFTGLISGSSSSSTEATKSSNGVGLVGSSDSNSPASNQAAEAATQQMIDWANDDSHGYSQVNDRYGNPDFDCSGAVIQAWENAGVKVKSAGASYTGNMMDVFLKLGFQDVTSSVNLGTGEGLQRGDVLLNSHHTGMWTGSGVVNASKSETNGTTGQPGDQTGKEFYINEGYSTSYKWEHVLRYVGSGSGKFGRGKGYVLPAKAASELLNGMGRAAAMSAKMSKYGRGTESAPTANSTPVSTPLDSYRSFATSAASMANTNNSMATTSAPLSNINNLLNKTTTSIPVNKTSTNSSSTVSGGVNYSQLLNVVINILTSIADNTDKLNVVVELLNQRLGTNITASDVSTEAMNHESIKSKIKSAFLTQDQGNDAATYFGETNAKSMGNIVSAMNAIASE